MTLDPLSWFAASIVEFLKETSESLLEQPLSKEHLELYFIPAIYETAKQVVGHGLSRFDNPILRLFFAENGLFHGETIVLSKALNRLGEMRNDRKSYLSRYGDIILRHQYEGNAFAVTYIPMNDT